MESRRRQPKIVRIYRYWRKKKSGCTTKLLWEPRQHSYESWKNTKFKTLGSLDKCWWTSTTSTTTPRLCRSRKRMSATTRRVYGGSKAVPQTNSSEQTNASKSESAIRRKWRLWLRCWSENRMDMVQRAAGKLAAYFVFVVLIMAEFLMAKLEFMVVAFFKAWRKAVSEKKSSMQFRIAGFRSWNVVPTIRRVVYTEYTPVACITNTTVFSHARTCNACLWLKSLTAQDCSVIIVRMNIVSHLFSHVISLLVSSTSSHFQSTTTRSTTWTVRHSPKRHCTPGTSFRTHTVDKQRQWTALARQLREWRKPAQHLSHKRRRRLLLLQFGLEDKWWADSMECYCYLRNVKDLLADGKTPYQRRFGEQFVGPASPFGPLV